MHCYLALWLCTSKIFVSVIFTNADITLQNDISYGTLCTLFPNTVVIFACNSLRRKYFVVHGKYRGKWIKMRNMKWKVFCFLFTKERFIICQFIDAFFWLLSLSCHTRPAKNCVPQMPILRLIVIFCIFYIPFLIKQFDTEKWFMVFTSWYDKRWIPWNIMFFIKMLQ